MTDVVPFLRPQLRAAGLEAKLDHLYFSAHEGRALAEDELVAAIARSDTRSSVSASSPTRGSRRIRRCSPRPTGSPGTS